MIDTYYSPREANKITNKPKNASGLKLMHKPTQNRDEEKMQAMEEKSRRVVVFTPGSRRKSGKTKQAENVCIKSARALAEVPGSIPASWHPNIGDVVSTGGAASASWERKKRTLVTSCFIVIAALYAPRYVTVMIMLFRRARPARHEYIPAVATTTMVVLACTERRRSVAYALRLHVRVSARCNRCNSRPPPREQLRRCNNV